MDDECENTGLGAFLVGMSPYQAVLLAAVFSFVISEGLTDEEAGVLALFFSTVASNIGLINQLHTEGNASDLPGLV